MRVIKTIILVFLLLLFGCHDDSTYVTFPTSDPVVLDSAKMAIINNRDTSEYFYVSFMREDKEFLCYHTMAEKSKFPIAYYDLAFQLFKLIQDDPYVDFNDTLKLASCDYATRQLIFYCLSKAFYLRESSTIKYYNSNSYIRRNIDSVINNNFQISISYD